MSLFKLESKRLKQIQEVPFRLESDMQEVVEKNLEKVFNLKFVYSEFQLNNLRVDTLAFDEESKSFVIIEYKRDKNTSVIDQGFSYLALLVNNKADFILQYNECMNESLRKNDVDWEQSRVMFVAGRFTPYQRKAIEFKDLPIELWEVKKYDNDFVHFNQIKPVETSESIKTVTRNKTIQAVSKEVRAFSVDDHFKDGWNESRQLFEALRERILAVDARLNVNARKSYIAFSIDSRNMVSARIYKSKIGLVFSRTEPKDLKDPEGRLVYVKDSFKYYNQHLSVINLESTDDIDYALYLVKQTHNRYFK